MSKAYGLLACVVALGCNGAEPRTLVAEGDAPALATEIPAAIVTPNRLETSIGTLTLTDGVPDAGTAQLVFDNIDRAHAIQAYLAGLPAASLYAIRQALRAFGPDNRTVALWEDRMDSRTLVLTGNTTSVYGMMWLDCKSGPMVLETPPNVLGIVDDAWFNNTIDFGRTGPDKGQGGKFLILPPGYDGAVPDGYHVGRSRAYGSWVLFRGFLVDGDPAPAAASIKKHFRCYPLNAAGSPPEMTFVNASGLAINTIHSMDATLFDEVNAIVQYEPNTAMDPETLGLLSSIGIEKGRPFAPDARIKTILADAAAIASVTVRAMAFRCRIPEAFYYEGSAWCTPFIGGSHLFLRDDVRLINPRAFFFFYATGITPAMTWKLIGKGSKYAIAFVDSEGRHFDGGQNYKLTLPGPIPVKDFWSVCLYDNQTRSMLQTDAPFPSVGSRSEGLATNPDGSVDVYFGPTAPEGHEANWVQTLPGKGWNTLLRLYGPLDPWFDKTWQPGEIVRLDD